MFRLWAQGFVKIRSWILSKILNLSLVKILSLSLVKFLKMNFDQDLCQKLWYELNPRVRCAFGNVFNFNRDKHIICDIFGNKLRMQDVLFTYFEQIVGFCTQIQLQLFCEDLWGAVHILWNTNFGSRETPPPSPPLCNILLNWD